MNLVAVHIQAFHDAVNHFKAGDEAFDDSIAEMTELVKTKPREASEKFAIEHKQGGDEVSVCLERLRNLRNQLRKLLLMFMMRKKEVVFELTDHLRSIDSTSRKRGGLTRPTTTSMDRSRSPTTSSGIAPWRTWWRTGGRFNLTTMIMWGTKSRGPEGLQHCGV